MFKRTALFIATILVANGVSAAKFNFHGDFNNRFQVYTNQNNFFNTNKPRATLGNASGKATIDDSYGEIKYRLWTTASTDDGSVTGVYAVEVGGIRYGREGTGRGQGGSFSGDGSNIKTRWAYTDVKLPARESHSFKVGLFPYKLNRFLWNETVTGIVLSGSLAEETIYSTAWVRGKERRNETAANDFKAVDGYSFRLKNKSIENTTLGAFLLYQISDADTSDPAGYGDITSAKYGLKQFGDVNFEIFSLGLEGSHSVPLDSSTAFVKWDVIYQGGNVSNANFITDDFEPDRAGKTSASTNFDLSTYFVNLSFGLEEGGTKYTYTIWYTSGDDNPDDNNMDAFLATDIDRTESIVFFEGGYSGGQNSTRSYLLDKGIIMNRLGIDHKASAKLTVGGAAIHFLTAEDISYNDDNGAARASSDLGVEFDVYASYMMYPNLELAVNAGYLISDDAMDFYDIKRDGNADNDIFRTGARLRYKF